MSIFSKIKDSIFGHQSAAPASRPEIPAGMAGGPPAGSQPEPGIAPPPAKVDVEQVLTSKARDKGNPDLNWRTSIVDLMKLLGIDSSLDNRKELATELGYTGATDGSAEMNIWLHKAVMQQLAKTGGTVPPSLTD